MAESLLVRKAGGGLKIEEIIKSFPVASGQTITAGTFVDFITGTYSVSTANTITTNTIGGNEVDAVALNQTTVVLLYSNSSQNDKVFATLLTISGSTVSVVSTVNVFNFASSSVAIAKLDNNRAMAIYRRNGNQGTAGAKVLTISGSSITLGSEANITGGNVNFLAAAGLDSTRVLFTFQNEATNRGNAMVINAPSTSITSLGTQFVIITSGVSQLNVVALTANTAIAVYSANSYSNIGYVSRLSISGSTVSSLGNDNFTSVSAGEPQVAKLNDTKAIISYRGASNLLYARTVNAQGSPTFGAEFTVNNSPTYDSSISSLEDGSKALIVYNESNVGKGKILLVSGTTVSNFTSTFAFTSEAIGQMINVSLSNTKTIVTYRGLDNFYYNRIVEAPLLITNTTAEKVFGLAKTGGTAGQTIEVFVNT
jgi:hypothetical protein